MDAVKTLSIVVRAAQDAQIDIERALTFLALLNTATQAQKAPAPAPAARSASTSVQ